VGASPSAREQRTPGQQAAVFRRYVLHYAKACGCDVDLMARWLDELRRRYGTTTDVIALERHFKVLEEVALILGRRP
jgi:hypothetical protein